MIAGDHDLDALFKRLHLANARRVWRDLVERAERETWTYRDCLTLLPSRKLPIASRRGWRVSRAARTFLFSKLIFTTNKALKAWGRVLHDEDLAQAIIDRVLERGRLVRLDGPSVRTLHVNLDDALREESDQGDEVIRISGKAVQNFRNPQQ